MYDKQGTDTQNYFWATPLSNAYKQEKPLTLVKVFFDQTHLSGAIFSHYRSELKEQVLSEQHQCEKP